jgi:vacuolar-type H+-ATPase subunit H
MIEKLAETKKKMISELEAQNEKRKYLEKNMTEKTKNYMEMVKGAEKR